MSAGHAANDISIHSTSNEVALVSEPLSGADLTLGTGFDARSYRAANVGATMDPLVMVDHYVMTEPTFGVHPHAGMSAVSLLFEDSEGLFHNRDSLGNDFDLQPGDLYWLSAGSGALHDEAPRPNARIHGLQVFVNVPKAQRLATPTALHVRSADMPVVANRDFCVKVVLGESNGVRGAISPSISMTILDGTIEPDRHFLHESVANRGIWIQAVEGSLDVIVNETTRRVGPNQGIAIKSDSAAQIKISNSSQERVHFSLFDGEQIAESYVHDGPFVMDSEQQILDIKKVYEAGQLGNIPNN
ncbi:MAG: pirin family protein [Pseudohongiellaceae bacterium]